MTPPRAIAFGAAAAWWLGVGGGALAQAMPVTTTYICERGVEVPANAFEAKLMEARIPGTEFETKQLVRQLRLQVMEEEAETREAINTDADLALAARDDKARQKVLALWHQKLKAKK